MRSVTLLKGIIIGTVTLVAVVAVFDLDLRKVPAQVMAATRQKVEQVVQDIGRESTDDPESVGVVDWLGGTVRVTGRGARPAVAVNDGQARLMAMGAAEADAYRKLAAVVTGLRLDSARTVGDYMHRDYQVRERIKAFIRGAQVVNEHVAEDGTAEVELELKLRGREGLESAIAASRTVIVSPKESMSRDEETRPQNDGSLKGASIAPAMVLKSPSAATGIIVDARGLGLKPALSPKAYTESGRMIFGIGLVDQKAFVERGLVEYAASVEEARTLPRVGSNPLVLKATGVRNSTDVVVADEAFEKLAAQVGTVGLVKQCKVVVVTD